MRLLLDSHSVLWFADDSPQMPEAIKKLIEDRANENTSGLPVFGNWRSSFLSEN